MESQTTNAEDTSFRNEEQIGCEMAYSSTIDNDPKLDTMTFSKWESPHFLANCGHVFNKAFLHHFRKGRFYKCPSCVTFSQFATPVRTDCVRSPDNEDGAKREADGDQCDDDNEKLAPTREVGFIRKSLQEAREHRRMIYEKSMANLETLLHKVISDSLWRSGEQSYRNVARTTKRASIVSKCLDQLEYQQGIMNEKTHPKIIRTYPMERFIRWGIFSSIDEFWICVSYRSGAYREHFRDQGILIDMVLSTKKKNRLELIRDNSDAYISLCYQCVDGIDGEYEDSKEDDDASDIVNNEEAREEEEEEEEEEEGEESSSAFSTLASPSALSRSRKRIQLDSISPIKPNKRPRK